MLLWLANLGLAGGAGGPTVPLGGIARDIIDTNRRQIAFAPTVIDKDHPQSNPVS